MNSFWFKIVCFLVIACSLVSYMTVKSSRAQDEKIAELEAREKSLELTIDKYQEAIDDILNGSADIQAETAQAQEKPSSPYADGIYEGTGQGYGGTITVKILIAGGLLSDAGIADAAAEDPEYLYEANKIFAKILEAGNADVDIISGATMSSEGIKEAVNDALSKAKEAKNEES